MGKCSIRKFLSGPCQGDSGGPLYTQSTDGNGDVKERTVVGIVSGGVGCGSDPDKKPNFPKWWARVSWFGDWIKCTKKLAEKYTLTHKKIEGKCDTSYDPNPFATPAAAKCDQESLFIEGADKESCFRPPFGSECYGTPELPDICKTPEEIEAVLDKEEYDESYYE